MRSALICFFKRTMLSWLTLEGLKEKTSIEAEKRSAADGLLKTFCTKQFMASAFLFKEIFSITGGLSRILQGVNIDFGKALVLLDEALAKLEALSPDNIIGIVDNDFPIRMGAKTHREKAENARRKGER